jgi:hypothetical protein
LTQRHDVWCTCTVIYDLQYCGVVVGCCENVQRGVWPMTLHKKSSSPLPSVSLTDLCAWTCTMYHQEYCDLTRAPASISQRTGCWLVVTQIVCCAVNTLKEYIEESQWCIARGAVACFINICLDNLLGIASDTPYMWLFSWEFICIYHIIVTSNLIC